MKLFREIWRSANNVAGWWRWFLMICDNDAQQWSIEQDAEMKFEEVCDDSRNLAIKYKTWTQERNS